MRRIFLSLLLLVKNESKKKTTKKLGQLFRVYNFLYYYFALNLYLIFFVESFISFIFKNHQKNKITNKNYANDHEPRKI